MHRRQWSVQPTVNNRGQYSRQHNGQGYGSSSSSNWRSSNSSANVSSFGSSNYLGGFRLTSELEYENVVSCEQFPPAVTQERITHLNLTKPNLSKGYELWKPIQNYDNYWEKKLDSFFKWLTEHPLLLNSSFDFISFNGTLVELLVTPLTKPKWTLYATKLNGKIYLTHSIEKAITSLSDEEHSGLAYCGEKFQELLTNSSCEIQNEKYFAVQETWFANYKMMVVTEMHACQEKSQIKSPKFMDIKQTIRQDSNKVKTRWWARCLIGSMDEIAVGHRGYDNHLLDVVLVKVHELPSMFTDFSWDPQKCFDYLHRALSVVSERVKADDPNIIYQFRPNESRWGAPLFSGTIQPNPEVQVIPAWFSNASIV